MAFWDSDAGRVVTSLPQPAEGYADWNIVDCGCCNGLEWNALEPTTCSRCQGNGILYHHIPSGALALYPGGPFLGHM